jgi:hypothetical protein
LALPAGQGDALFADDGLVAVGQRFDELVGHRGAGGGLDLVHVRVGPAVGDVGGDGVGEQEAVLEHDADAAAQFG